MSRLHYIAAGILFAASCSRAPAPAQNAGEPRNADFMVVVRDVLEDLYRRRSR